VTDTRLCVISYALFFGSRNAKVVVNDVSVEAAQKVVDEVKKGKSNQRLRPPCSSLAEQITRSNTAGGQAVAAAGSVTDGKPIVDQAVKAFGTVHILINNAGILRKLVRSSYI
jgi:multifunctional beta-oxidation protein